MNDDKLGTNGQKNKPLCISASGAGGSKGASCDGALLSSSQVFRLPIPTVESSISVDLTATVVESASSSMTVQLDLTGIVLPISDVTKKRKIGLRIEFLRDGRAVAPPRDIQLTIPLQPPHYSLISLENILDSLGLRLNDVEVRWSFNEGT